MVCQDVCVCVCVCVCVRVHVCSCMSLSVYVVESECAVSKDFLSKSFYFWQPIRGISGRQLQTISHSYEYQSDLWLQLHFHSQVTNNLKRERGGGRKREGRSKRRRERRYIQAEKLETQEFETT